MKMAEECDPCRLEDDWFYDSITRYKKLNMYELQNPIHLMELTDCGSLCIVSRNNLGNFEVSEYGLPNKISSEDDFVKDGDLKLRGGTFVPTAISQMKILKGEHKLVASREKTPGVTLYNLPPDSSTDEITKSSVCLSTLINPCFSLHENKAVLVTDATNAAVLLDLTEGKTVKAFNCFESTSNQSQLSPVFITNNVFTVCHNNCGSLTVQDIRQDSTSQFVPVSAIGGEGSWTINSSFNSMTTTQAPPKVIVVSNIGCVIVFDIRNWNTPVYRSKVNVVHTSDKDMNLCVQFKDSDSNFISLSGFDGNVYVFDISDTPKEIFVHDGHRHVEGCDSNTVTKSHAWLTNQENYLISAAFNRTVHSWQYEE